MQAGMPGRDPFASRLVHTCMVRAAGAGAASRGVARGGGAYARLRAIDVQWPYGTGHGAVHLAALGCTWLQRISFHFTDLTTTTLRQACLPCSRGVRSLAPFIFLLRLPQAV